MRKIITFTLLTLLLNSTIAQAAGKASAVIPDLKSCPKLASETAYDGDNNSLRLLFQGKDGYIFRSRQDLYDQFDIDDKGLAILKALSTTLEEQGTTLFIALLPTRGIAGARYLPDTDPVMKDYDPIKARSSYELLIKKLNDNGIRTVGNPDTKAIDNIYKADQHWSSAGARAMAAILATEIKKHKTYKTLNKAEFKTTILPEISFSGLYNEGLQAICGFTMPPEKDILTKTELVAQTVSDSDLFADKSAEIVLVGTSNSKKNDNHLNFDGYLREYLSVDVDNRAITGGGFSDSLLAYLGSEQARTHPAKILIWEIPGYYSLSGEDNSKTILQAIATSYGACKSPLAVSGDVTIKSEITKVLKDLAGKKINATDTYVEIRLGQSVKKSFAVIFSRTDGKAQTYSFKPSKRLENDGIFYFTPQNAAKAPLSHIALKVPKELHELTAKITLCALPEKIRFPQK